MPDPRFARLSTDPRFRKPKKQQNRVVVDERFKSVLKQEKKRDKSSKGLVDKYGRRVSSTKGEDNLKRFYRLEGDEEEEGKEGEDEAPARPDYARGAVLLESSDEEEIEDDDKEGEESDTGGIVRLGYDSDEVDDEADDDLAEIDLDEDNFSALEAQAAAYSKEHPEEDGEEADEAPRTRRIAVVNLDWDHVRASHLYKIFSSLVSTTAPVASTVTKKKKHANMKEAPQVNVVRGKVLSVVVYPSDFGKERMAREEREGPPAEIFKKKKKESEEITAKSLYELGGEDEVDDNALRKYQLERLRYYYAIVTCDNVEAASHVYDELQGTELERSANVFDMSFVPDDMEFENEPRDQATEDDSGAVTTKGIDFVTPALRHSKVALTWDEDDPERGHVTRRTLTKQEIEDGDFRAFIASSSEEESEAESSKLKGKKNKKSERDRLRALLLGGNDDTMPEGWGDDDKDEDDVDMEITFTPGLIGKKDEGGDETTLEKYQRKMREKRKKRKDEVKEKGGEKGKGKEKEADEFFGASSDEEEEDRRPAPKKKGDRKGKKSAEVARGEEATADELELLAASNNPDGETKHFDFKAVLKAEKKGKKGRKGKKTKLNEDELQEDFSIDVQDERFKVLHEDHHFAIDPSNPHFKKTKGMTALLDERRKRLSQQSKEAPESKARSHEDGPGNPSLQKLVESVKRKSAESGASGQGKRRKL